MGHLWSFSFFGCSPDASRLAWMIHLRAGAMFSLPATHGVLSPWSTATLGTWPRPWAQPHALLRAGGAQVAMGEGTCLVLVLTCCSLCPCHIHHTKRPCPFVPRAGADGGTQHLYLPLQSLAGSLA